MSSVTCPACWTTFTAPESEGQCICPVCDHPFTAEEGATSADLPVQETFTTRWRGVLIGGACAVVVSMMLCCGLAVSNRKTGPVSVAKPADAPARDARQEKIRALLGEAGRAAENRDVATAIVKANDVLALDPGNPDAFFVRGCATAMLAQMGNGTDMVHLKRAVEDLRRASEKRPEHRKLYEDLNTSYRKLAVLMGIE